jgi:hypothetical protein
MLKVGDYCFRVYPPTNLHLDTVIMIYNVTRIVNENEMYTNIQDSTTGQKSMITERRVIKYYTKCSSTTIEELKEEFPEAFI